MLSRRGQTFHLSVSVPSVSFWHRTGQWSPEHVKSCYSLHRACCARQGFFPCFDTRLLLGICSPWQTWTHNAFDFSLGPSYKSFQQCYGIPTDLKVYIGKVCISALLQNSECFSFFYLFLPVCSNCCCCPIVTFMQAIAPPPVQSWALVWIDRANQKVLLKVTFFLYETECRECELLFLSLDFFFLCVTIGISEIPSLLLLEHVLTVVGFFC